MNVNLKVGVDGETHIIAAGSYLIDAARRIGTRLPAECGGTGQCDTCAVTIDKGAELCSAITESERKQLSPIRMAAGERLACQVRIEREGDLTVTPVPRVERADTSEETASTFRKSFRELPLNKKVRTLFELEALTMTQTVDVVSNLPSTVASRVLDVLAKRGRKLDQRERETGKPDEHQPDKV